jgi:hypothetical protein
VRAAFLVLLLLNLALLAYARLGGEASDAAGGADAGLPVAPLRRAADGNAGPRCATLGPFATQAGAQRGAAALLSGRHGSRLHAADAPGAPSYWVVIPTKTMQDATKIGMRLRAAGVSDLVIMPPETNGTDAVVSLGIYSERERADRRVQDLKRYAVTPSIVDQPHTVTTWWLDVELTAGESTPDISALARSSGESGSLRAAACAQPATPAPAAAAAPAPPAAPAAAKPSA